MSTTLFNAFSNPFLITYSFSWYSDNRKTVLKCRNAGHRFRCQSRAHITFLLLTNINFGRISYRFRDIDTFSSKIACFPTLPCVTPHSAGTPGYIYINVLYTPAKRTFNGLQFCRWHLPIFIRLVVVASQIREIRRNSDKIWPYSSSRLSKVTDLCVNRKLTCDFLLVTYSNFGPISYRFPDIHA